jgi:hypothetical protein
LSLDWLGVGATEPRVAETLSNRPLVALLPLVAGLMASQVSCLAKIVEVSWAGVAARFTSTRSRLVAVLALSFFAGSALCLAGEEGLESEFVVASVLMVSTLACSARQIEFVVC